jgi:homoserine acetyltransferase
MVATIQAMKGKMRLLFIGNSMGGMLRIALLSAYRINL